MKHQLVKVTFEYSDTIEILEENCQEWLDEVNGKVVMAAIHGDEMKKYKWKVKKKSTTTR